MSLIFRAFILIGFLGAMAGCSNHSATSIPTSAETNPPGSAGIVSGTKAGLDEAIAKSTVMVNLPNGNVCSGILLNDHVVLTAAHCLSHGDSGYFVHLPEAFVSRNCSASMSAEISLPPNPKTGDEGDVLPDLGLLKLRTPLCPAGTPAKVIFDSKIRVKDKLKAAGFGFGTTINRPDYFDMTVISSDYKTLHGIYTTQASEGTVDMEEWKEIEPYHKEYSENFIFALANQEEKTLCNGDSGGPVYREKQGVLHLVGIVRGAFMHSEKGVAVCNGAYIQLFTPIDPYLDWIQEKLAIW